MRVRTLGLTCLACACASPQPPQSMPAAAPAPAPSAAVADAAPEAEADAGGVLVAPPMPELSKERAALAEQLARARFVVRGRVREAKEVVEPRAGGEVRYHYAVVDVLEWLEGDAKGVVQAYTKSFPIWNQALPITLSKSPGLGHRDPPLELTGRAGEERLFLVNLPHQDNLAHGEPGPPPFILKRWGKYSVGVVDHLPLDAREEIAATRRDLERRRAWIEDNARRLDVRDRFVGASPEAVARAVASFVVEQLRQRAKLKVEHGAPEHTAGDVEVFRFPLSGDADATGTLGVSVVRATGRLRHFQLDVPVVKKKSAASATGESALADAKARLGILSEGGELFGRATPSLRGDGLELWRVELGAGYLHGSRPGAPGRVVRVSMTHGAGLIFEYSNAFSASSGAAGGP